MKKPSLFRIVLPHLTLILSTACLVFFVINLINPAMAFLQSTLSLCVFVVFSLASLILSVYAIIEREKARQIKNDKEKPE